VNGPQDFQNPDFRTECCYSNKTTTGCADQTVNTIKTDSVNLIIIPNCSILAIELIIIILVPFLIGNIALKLPEDPAFSTGGSPFFEC
jgi:hypothetical protein